MLRDKNLDFPNHSDIVGDSMNHKRLDRIEKVHEKLRNSKEIKSKAMQGHARSLGRIPENRGKEPTWINPNFPALRPLSIPHHSKGLNRFTAQSILDQLEEDLDRWKEYLKRN